MTKTTKFGAAATAILALQGCGGAPVNSNQAVNDAYGSAWVYYNSDRPSGEKAELISSIYEPIRNANGKVVDGLRVSGFMLGMGDDIGRSCLYYVLESQPDAINKKCLKDPIAPMPAPR